MCVKIFTYVRMQNEFQSYIEKLSDSRLLHPTTQTYMLFVVSKAPDVTTKWSIVEKYILELQKRGLSDNKLLENITDEAYKHIGVPVDIYYGANMLRKMKSGKTRRGRRAASRRGRSRRSSRK